jgi:hypothetical protein
MNEPQPPRMMEFIHGGHGSSVAGAPKSCGFWGWGWGWVFGWPHDPHPAMAWLGRGSQGETAPTPGDRGVILLIGLSMLGQRRVYQQSGRGCVSISRCHGRRAAAAAPCGRTVALIKN